jgi:hypothetical protein
MDTMTDLVADFIGACFGALLGFWLIGRAQRKQSERLPEMVEEMQGMFGRRQTAAEESR